MKMAINTLFARAANFAMLSVLLPVMYGCGGGGSSSVGSLFGTTSTGTVLASTGDGTGLAVYHNPEPATMLLLGTGIVAMGFVKARSKS